MGWQRVRSLVLGTVIGGVALVGCATYAPVAGAQGGSVVGSTLAPTATSAPSTGVSLPRVSANDPAEPPKATAALGRASASGVDDFERFDSLSAIAFPSAAHGVLLRVHCGAGSVRCAVDALTSADGGLTWSAPAVVANFTRTPNANPYATVASKLTFVDEATGYAYGPDLFRTTDGGRSWRRLAVSGSVQAVVRFGGHTWVVRSPCPTGSGGEDGCGSVIDELGEAGVLTPLAAQPAADGTVVQLVVVSTDTAYSTVLVGEKFGLRVTTDAGAHWAPLPLPCLPSQATGGPASLAAAGGRLWMVCASQAGAGAEVKQLFISDDAGHTWQRPGNLETSGYADHIVAISVTIAWRFGGRAPVYVTTDGGRTWTARLPDVFNGAFGAPNGSAFVGFARLWLLDPVGGYTSDPHHLYVTDDGGTSWTTVTLPAV